MTSGFQLILALPKVMTLEYRIMGSSNRSIQDLMKAQVDKQQREQRKLFSIVYTWQETLSRIEERYFDRPSLVSFLLCPSWRYDKPTLHQQWLH